MINFNLSPHSFCQQPSMLHPQQPLYQVYQDLLQGQIDHPLLVHHQR